MTFSRSRQNKLSNFVACRICIVGSTRWRVESSVWSLYHRARLWLGMLVRILKYMSGDETDMSWRIGLLWASEVKWTTFALFCTQKSFRRDDRTSWTASVLYFTFSALPYIETICENNKYGWPAPIRVDHLFFRSQRIRGVPTPLLYAISCNSWQLQLNVAVLLNAFSNFSPYQNRSGTLGWHYLITVRATMQAWVPSEPSESILPVLQCVLEKT